MKLTKSALTIVLAMAGLGPFANGGQVPFPQDGDLFMGFHSTGASNEYLVDVGPYLQFDGQAVGFHLSLGNFGTDLRSVFGTRWPTDPNVEWGSAGTLDALSKLFATKAEPVVGTFAQPWVRQSTSSQNNTGSTIDTMAFGDYAGQDATASNPTGVIHPTTGLSWASYQNGANSPGGSFNAWVPTVEAPQVPGTGTGIAATRLDLFRMDPDNTGGQLPGQYIGSFSIDRAGNVSYDVFATVTLPTVTLTVTDGSASEVPSNDIGSVRITRTGSTTDALTVNYTIGGTATNGTDYKKLTGRATLRSGAASGTVQVRPIDDTIPEPDETVILTIAPNASYIVGTPNTGTVVIHSNE